MLFVYFLVLCTDEPVQPFVNPRRLACNMVFCGRTGRVESAWRVRPVVFLLPKEAFRCNPRRIGCMFLSRLHFVFFISEVSQQLGPRLFN